MSTKSFSQSDVSAMMKGPFLALPGLNLNFSWVNYQHLSTSSSCPESLLASSRNAPEEIPETPPPVRFSVIQERNLSRAHDDFCHWEKQHMDEKVGCNRLRSQYIVSYSAILSKNGQIIKWQHGSAKSFFMPAQWFCSQTECPATELL